MERTFIARIKPPKARAGAAWWWVFRESALLVRETDTGTTLPYIEETASLGMTPLRTQYLGTLDGDHCFAAEVDKATEPPEGMRFEGLRALYGRLPDDLFFLAGRAIQIIAWDRTHQYCGHCGTRTVYHKVDRATECPNCGLVNYPRIAPAVIVAVERGDELLLARNANFPAAFFSVLAGFVEAGESLEETVRRELREEVSIEVKDITYFGSQSWPFPNSLMVGFTATYESGEIRVDTNEVAEAAWFRHDTLPRVPPGLSIARKLIDAFIEKHGGTIGD
ncbi:MAG: NAD(+) diphosphatase [Chloroflexota bacterium]|nr:NAD(+) diphosphatase [Chloroflexota bacterium]